MNRWFAVVVLSLFPLAGPRALVQGVAQAREEPRALVERAIKAQGGEDVLWLQQAGYLKLKGKLTVVKGDTGIEVEIFKQFDGKSKSTFQILLDGGKVDIHHLFAGTEGWQNLGGKWEKMSADEMSQARAEAHADRVTSLLPLLHKKGFTLAPLAEIKVKDRPAVGIKVSAKDRPDVQLYFDKETSLPCLSRYKTRDKEQNKDVENEIILGDYKDLDFTAQNEAVLKKAGVALSDGAVLAFLKRQAADPEVLQRVKALVRQLADDSFDNREKAGEELVAVGTAAVPALQAASKDDDPEVSRRAADCLKKIQEQADPQVVKAALRLLAIRRPAGAAPVLLALAAAGEESLRQEAQAALYAVAQNKGEPDLVLVKALQDSDRGRRSAAEAALGKDGGAYARQPGRRLYPRGVKQPMKITLRTDNETLLEAEVSEVQLFNRFEDKLFARPE